MTPLAVNDNQPLYVVRVNPDRRQRRHPFLVSQRRDPTRWVAKMPSREDADAYASRMSRWFRGVEL